MTVTMTGTMTGTMTLGLTSEHLELAASVQGWAARHSPPAVVRAAAEGGDAGAARYRGELAPALADQGLLGLHLAESDGGQGFGLPELAIATAELGCALLPGAFLPTVLRAPQVLTWQRLDNDPNRYDVSP